MSQLRHTVVASGKYAPPYATALRMIYDSVRRRRGLIYGKLSDGHGHFCPIGAFWEDNPRLALDPSIIDEIAAYNDSLKRPTITQKKRKEQVLQWLRWRMKTLASTT
jgi:hypothetical protein